MVRITIDRRAHPGSDDAVERAMVRYWAAHAEYRDTVVRNMELTLNGGEPSELARLDEERAFEELDSARHALFTAAARAFPTIH
jgi:hypothetical protein